MVWGVVDRLTRDLDHFATSPAAVGALLPAPEEDVALHPEAREE